MGGPAIRQAGVFYRVNSRPCNSRRHILTCSSTATQRSGLRAFSQTRCTQFDPEPQTCPGTVTRIAQLESVGDSSYFRQVALCRFTVRSNRSRGERE